MKYPTPLAKSVIISLLTATWVTGLAVIPAQAVVTTVGFWRGGENDSGATAGGAATNPTNDRTGNNNLVQTGTPLYSANVPAALLPNDKLSYQFNGTTDLYTGNPYTYTDNFGIEGWFNPTSGGGWSMLNGSGGDGYGFIAYDLGAGLSWYGIYSGHHFFTGGPLATAGQWVHLALVRDNGVATYYVNGVVADSGTGPAYTPITPTTSITLGGTPSAPGFNGLVDEARIFTFAPGAFSVSDLLLTQTVLDVPEPSTMALLALGCGLISRYRNRVR